MKTESTCENGLFPHQLSQVITDDFVESLSEIGSFFMPNGLMAAPVEYVNDIRKAVPLESNVLVAEIATQQILECGKNLTVRLAGSIIEGFDKPLDFTFVLSHTFKDAKILKDRNSLQTFELPEFLRLEYPPIRLILTDTLFSLYFLDFRADKDEPKQLLNGSGCLLFGETES